MLSVYLCWKKRNINDGDTAQLSIDLLDQMLAFYRVNQLRVYRGYCRSHRSSQAACLKIFKCILANAHPLCRIIYRNQAFLLLLLFCLVNSTERCLEEYSNKMIKK